MVQHGAPRATITVAVLATRIVSVLQLALGCGTFGLGVASIVILTSTAHFADQYGLGLFGGVFIALAGFVGMFSSFRFNNRYLCMLNLLCNIFIWFLVLVLLVLFGLAADFYDRMKGATYCFRIRDIPISSYYNRQDYELRLNDPICLNEQKRVAPDGFDFSLTTSIFLSLELFIGAAAIILCMKALYGMCGGTTPRIQAGVGQKYSYNPQAQKPVDYGKGYEMKSSGSANANYPPPAYNGSKSAKPAQPQSKSISAPISSTNNPPPKTDNAAPSYFL